MKTKIFKTTIICLVCSLAIYGLALQPKGDCVRRHPLTGKHNTTTKVVRSGWPHISDAYIPYDPPKGIFGFFRLLHGQHYDAWPIHDRNYAPAKIYATDILGMPGFLISITDPDAEIVALKRYGDLHERRIPLKVMEVTPFRKVVFINNTWQGELYHRVLIVVTSPHPERVFDFELWGFPDN